MLPAPDTVAHEFTRESPDWSIAHDALRAAGAARDTDWLVGLLQALDAIDSPLVPTLRSWTIETLSLIPGAVPLLLAHMPPSAFSPPEQRIPGGGMRRMAAYLSMTSAQSPAVLLDALPLLAGRPLWHEVLLAWVQEAVVRGADLSHEPAVVALWREAAAQDHPLASLPLAPLSLEAQVGASAQRFMVLGASGWGGGVPWRADHATLPAASRPLPALSPLPLTPRQYEDIAAFYLTPVVSNRSLEVAVFRAAAPLDHLSPGLIARLPLSCHQGRDAEEGDPLPPAPAPPALALGTQPITPEIAFSALLKEAADGGCYCTAWSGAWGRLAAWRSLAGMVGVAGSHAAVEEAAARCQWGSFQSDAEWFYHLMDVTLVCLRADRQTVVVVAGTDTD